MTDIYYTSNDGIRFWENDDFLPHSKFGTISIFSPNGNFALVRILVELMELIAPMALLLRWFITRLPLNCSQIQEAKISKALGSLAEFDLVEKRKVGDAYHTLSQAVLPVTASHLDAASQSQYCALLFQGDCVSDAGRQLHDYYSTTSQTIDTQFMLIALKDLAVPVVGRIYEDDTHAALQLFGDRTLLNEISAILDDLSVTTVNDGDVARLLQ